MTLPAFEVAKVSKHRLTVAVTHPNRVIGTPISIVLATAAYLIDKKVLHSIHPKIPKYFDFRQGFYSLNEWVIVPWNIVLRDIYLLTAIHVTVLICGVRVKTNLRAS